MQNLGNLVLLALQACKGSKITFELGIDKLNSIGHTIKSLKMS